MTGTALLTPNRKCFQLSEAEIKFDSIKEMYATLGMHKCSEKTTIYTKTTLSLMEWGTVIMGLEPNCQTIFMLAGLSFSKVQIGSPVYTLEKYTNK